MAAHPPGADVKGVSRTPSSAGRFTRAAARCLRAQRQSLAPRTPQCVMPLPQNGALLGRTQGPMGPPSRQWVTRPGVRPLLRIPATGIPRTRATRIRSFPRLHHGRGTFYFRAPPATGQPACWNARNHGTRTPRRPAGQPTKASAAERGARNFFQGNHNRPETPSPRFPQPRTRGFVCHPASADQGDPESPNQL